MRTFGTIIYALNEDNQMVRFLGTVKAADATKARKKLNTTGRGYEKLQSDYDNLAEKKFMELQKLN